MIYVDPLQKMMEGFVAIIDFLQERQYALDDTEKGKLNKMYAFNTLPKLTIE